MTRELPVGTKWWMSQRLQSRNHMFKKLKETNFEDSIKILWWLIKYRIPIKKSYKFAIKSNEISRAKGIMQ